MTKRNKVNMLVDDKKPKSHTEGIDLPTYKDIEEAAIKLDGVAIRTPVKTSAILDSQLGVKAFIKCENFQRIGAFKFRGGYNYLSRLAPEQTSNGVITYSSGNHAQGTALASKILGIHAHIIIPEDAPALKVQKTKEYGGNVIHYDRYKETRKAAAAKVQAQTGGHLFYDHKYIVAGQGTTGKELIEEVLDGGHGELDYLFVSIGGGGLISGCCLAAEELAPGCKVIGVEPEAGNKVQQSFERGENVTIETAKTIADGAQVTQLGQTAYAIIREKVEKVITVTDDQLVDELRFYKEKMDMVVEPTACLGLAGLRKMVVLGEVPPNSKCGVILTGQNVDMERYHKLLARSKAVAEE
mmetsp:Transcript_16751/g.23281  ORF Transcript_16751/g.23281 Transcript_16751/m.23281 type:complete len:355 (-) Transcript_16751:164-1228(-)